ncbi:MAG: hypothetical protein ABSH28_09275 [Acidobacteriota bacterium]|jgi:phenylacetate-CoA ligase
MSLLTRLYWSCYLACHMRGQAQYPFRAPASIAEDRDRSVRRMVAYASRHVPYYRRTLAELGLHPGDFRTVSDLARLRLLGPDWIRSHPEQFVSETMSLQRCLGLETSGSSGLRRTIYADPGSLFRNAAHAERERGMVTAAIGKRHGYREAVIVYSPSIAVSSTPRVQQFLRQHALFPSRMQIQRLYIDSLESPAAYLPRLNEFAPDVIQGYGSGIESLFDHLHATGASFHRPRVVCYHSDGISARMRQLILTHFKIPVFSAYQACEALKIGFECSEHQGYHINIDLYPVRIIGKDGDTLPEGEVGEVVVSNLVNRAMVLLNYRLGDLAVMLTEPCRCGRTLPRLLLQEGTAHDFIRLPSGRIVDPSHSYIIFTAEPALREYQMVQITPSHFRLNLVVPDPGEREACGRRIAAAFHRHFPGDATAEVVFVDRIELSGGGKKKAVVLLPREQQSERLQDGKNHEH